MDTNLENNNQQTTPQQPEVKEGFNKTPLLVAVLVILTGVLLVVSIAGRNGGKIPLIDNSSQEVVGTTLSLSEQRTATVSGSAEVDVLIDSGKEKVNGIQMEISYNPDEMQVSDIVPGDFIPGSQVLIKKIDSQAGTINLALAAGIGEEGSMGSGTVATIIFTKTTEGESELSFTPNTIVTAPGSSDSILYKTSSGAVTSTNSSQ